MDHTDIVSVKKFTFYLIHGKHDIHRLRFEREFVTIGISNREKKTSLQHISVCIDKFDNSRIYRILRHFNIVSQAPCCQRNSSLTLNTYSFIIKIRNLQFELGIIVRNARRRIDPTFKFEPVAPCSNSGFPATGTVSKNVYGITIILVLSYSDLRLTHSEHILPIVDYIFDLVTVIVYQSEFQVGHDCIRCQRLAKTFITDSQRLSNGNDVFMVSLQGQIFHLLSCISGFGKIHPVKCRFARTDSSFHNQASSILTARFSILSHTTDILCCYRFKCINLPFVGCVAIYGVKNCIPFFRHFTTVHRENRSIRSRVSNLPVRVPCRSNVSGGIVISQVNLFDREIRSGTVITDIDARQHTFHIYASYRIHRRSDFAYYLLPVHRNPRIPTSRRTVCQPFAGLGVEHLFHCLNLGGRSLYEARHNIIKFLICHNHDASRCGSGRKHSRETHSGIVSQVLSNSCSADAFQVYRRCF